MKIPYLLAILVFAFSCGPKKEPKKNLAPEEKLQLVYQKADLYKSLLPSVQHTSGFIESDKCDSLLFTSLLTASGASINLMQAEAAPGRWLRRPLSLPECFSNGLSRSTISRDQLLGVLWAAFSTGNLSLLNRMWNYGQARDWFMGDDNENGLHTLMTPIVPLLARLRNHLAKQPLDSVWSKLPLASESGIKTGFEAHLQVLQLLLDKKFRGGYSSSALGVIYSQWDRQPRNPLFQYAAGDIEGAVDSLLDENIWPSNRLPTSSDRCAPWVLERDADTSDWEPCPEQGRIHSGADLLFIVYLIRAGA